MSGAAHTMKTRTPTILTGIVLGTASAYAQPPDPIRVQKAAQELTLYTRAGEVCGFRNHPGTALYLKALRAMDEKSVELGIASASLMVDGMIARHGKKRVCTEAQPTRPGMERLLNSLN